MFLLFPCFFPNFKNPKIELMMKLNSFQPAEEMPEPIPIDENHPFVAPVGDDETEEGSTIVPAQKQYVAHLPERKEWQTQLPTQDAADVFTKEDSQKPSSKR